MIITVENLSNVFTAGFAEEILQLFNLRFCFKWSVKENQEHYVAKILMAIWETFLYENICNFNSYNLSYKLAFISFLSYPMNQKARIVSGPVT